MSKDDVRIHLDLADEKLVVAKDLLREGHLRDATSRSYYAMFHAGMALVAAKGLRPRTHRGLAHLLRERFVGPGLLTREQVARFEAEERARHMSDYSLDFTIEEAEVAEAIAFAEDFVHQAEALLR